jgi:hypothetical protein
MTSSRTTTSIYIAARIRVKFFSRLLIRKATRLLYICEHYISAQHAYIRFNPILSLYHFYPVPSFVRLAYLKEAHKDVQHGIIMLLPSNFQTFGIRCQLRRDETYQTSYAGLPTKEAGEA